MRTASPLMVQALWDGIEAFKRRHRGPVTYQPLKEVVKLPPGTVKDNLRLELENAIKDDLVVSYFLRMTRSREEQSFSLPDLRDVFVKGDHDWYCFKCHAGGSESSSVQCRQCPRVFHRNCLGERRIVTVFVCPCCKAIAMSRRQQSPELNVKQMNKLIEYSCERFVKWDAPLLNTSNGHTWANASGRDAPRDYWRHERLVYFPIDLMQILQKARNCNYKTFAEYQVDSETIIHSLGVYFGTEMCDERIVAKFQKQLIHDVEEMKLCPDCFQRSNERQVPKWFCLPCTKPHEVVWAKYFSYPYWPAKVIRIIDGPSYDVRFFGGDHERALIDVEHIRPINTSLSSLRVKKTRDWKKAFAELKTFQALASSGLPAAGSSVASQSSDANNNDASRDLTDTKDDAEDVGKDSSLKQAQESGSGQEVSGSLNIEAGQEENENKAGSRISKKRKTSVSASCGLQDRRVRTESQKRKQPGKVTETVAPETTAPLKTATVDTPISSPEANTAAAAPAARRKAPRGVFKDCATDCSDVAQNQPVNLDVHDSDICELDEYDAKHYRTLLLIASGKSIDEATEMVQEWEQKRKGHATAGVDPEAPTPGPSSSVASLQTEAMTSLPDSLREVIRDYVVNLRVRHEEEIANVKKKHWCTYCQRGALYYCCSLIYYCSVECQRLHWYKEHHSICTHSQEDSCQRSVVVKIDRSF